MGAPGGERRLLHEQAHRENVARTRQMIYLFILELRIFPLLRTTESIEDGPAGKEVPWVCLHEVTRSI